MKVIGLCGGSGSGKGAVSDIISNLGIPVIDTDAIYHEITSSDTDCLRALRAEFGEGVIQNGVLNRPALAKIVFGSENSKEKRLKLNSITHKYVLDQVRVRLNKYNAQNYDICVVDVPLLFESGFDKESDITIAVIADREIRIERIKARDNISTDAAVARVDSQITNEELVRLTDFQIINNSDVAALKSSVAEVFNKIKI